MHCSGWAMLRPCKVDLSLICRGVKANPPFLRPQGLVVGTLVGVVVGVGIFFRLNDGYVVGVIFTR